MESRLWSRDCPGYSYIVGFVHFVLCTLVLVSRGVWDLISAVF